MMEKTKLTVDVVIPTFRPDRKLNRLLAGLLRQTWPLHQVVIVNTGSPLERQDVIRQRFAARKIPLTVLNISQDVFDHGGTRHMAAEQCTGDLILFMTQDAVPRNRKLVECLVRPFSQVQVAAAYARQLPDRDCPVIERYTRSFNYPAESRIKTKADLQTLGIKTFFCSNVCAIYRRTVYETMGGFPTHMIFNEDMVFAGRLVQAGYGVAYVADAQVIHSHHYRFRQQFSRNFDLAVSQKQFPEIFAAVSSETEGIRLVRQTVCYLIRKKRYDQLPVLFLGSGAKFLGYRLGKWYDRLPLWMVRRLSGSPWYWDHAGERQDAGSNGYDEVLVSVCIPAYNNGAYIQKTMESVLRQTHRCLELVVVDDCSTDNTVEVVRQVARHDSRVRLEQNRKNLGMAENWTECIRQARGEYVKLLCADDILYPESIAKELAPFLNHTTVQLVMSDTVLINIDGQRVGAFCRWPKSGLMDGRKLAKYSLLLNDFFGAPCNNLFRRASALRVGGFDPAFSYIPDFDFWLSMACLGDVYILHEKLNAFRIRKDSNTGAVMGGGGKGADYLAEHVRLVEKHSSALGLTRPFQKCSIWWRAVRSRLIHVYLTLFTK